jgi:predicted SAM-dependent methyltransferase
MISTQYLDSLLVCEQVFMDTIAEGLDLDEALAVMRSCYPFLQTGGEEAMAVSLVFSLLACCLLDAPQLWLTV